jgi:hypothetical protein
MDFLEPIEIADKDRIVKSALSGIVFWYSRILNGVGNLYVGLGDASAPTERAPRKSAMHASVEYVRKSQNAFAPALRERFFKNGSPRTDGSTFPFQSVGAIHHE